MKTLGSSLEGYCGVDIFFPRKTCPCPSFMNEYAPDYTNKYFNRLIQLSILDENRTLKLFIMCELIINSKLATAGQTLLDQDTLNCKDITQKENYMKKIAVSPGIRTGDQ